MENRHGNDVEDGALRKKSVSPLDAHVRAVNLSAYAHLDAEKVLARFGKYAPYQVI